MGGSPKKSRKEKLETRAAANRRYRQAKRDAGMRPIALWTYMPRTGLPDSEQYIVCRSNGVIPEDVRTGKVGVEIDWDEGGRFYAGYIVVKGSPDDVPLSWSIFVGK